MDKILNSQGKIWYGLHFYSGLAEYREDKKSFRVFLNEQTIRKMDPSFAGRPVFVRHVEDVNENLDELRGEADGWVVESFFNESDGKHWCKFITVSEKAESAIRQGWRLSNCYIQRGPKGPGGLWNGINYDYEVKNGEYEHLAIVNNPRYQESIILTPEEFKAYNDSKIEELKKLANSQDEKKNKKESGMKFNFWKRQKVENELDLSDYEVELPNSKKVGTVAHFLNEYDMSVGQTMNASLESMVDLDGTKMSLNDFMGKYKACNEQLKACNEELEGMKAAKKKEEDEKNKNTEDEEAKKKALELAEHEEKEIEKAKNDLAEKEKVAKEKADKLRNANKNAEVPKAPVIELSSDQVARGKSRYGSAK